MKNLRVIVIVIIIAAIGTLSFAFKGTKTANCATVKDSRITITSVSTTGFPKVKINTSIENIKSIEYFDNNGNVMGSENWKPYPMVNIYTPSSALFQLHYKDGSNSGTMNINDYLKDNKENQQ